MRLPFGRLEKADGHEVEGEAEKNSLKQETEASTA